MAMVGYLLAIEFFDRPHQTLSLDALDAVHFSFVITWNPLPKPRPWIAKFQFFEFSAAKVGGNEFKCQIRLDCQSIHPHQPPTTRQTQRLTFKMSSNLTHVLFENASGFALFEVTLQEEVAAKSRVVSFRLPPSLVSPLPENTPTMSFSQKDTDLNLSLNRSKKLS